MEKRKVYLGPRQLASVDTLSEILNLDLIIDFLSPVNFQPIIYGSLFQAGAEQFMLISRTDKENSKLDFIESRINYISDEPFHRTYKLIDETFAAYFPEDYEKNKEFSEVIKLKGFLGDLLISMDQRISFVETFKLPDMDKLKVVMPLELFIPIQNLFSTFNYVNAELPIPEVSTLVKHTKKFEKLLESDIFVQYAKSHRNLEERSITPRTAISIAVQRGHEIMLQNLGLLKLKKLSLAILPVSAKVVDTVFGKIPGALADFFATQIESLYKDDKRIVIYHLSDMVDQIVRDRINMYAGAAVDRHSSSSEDKIKHS